MGWCETSKGFRGASWGRLFRKTTPWRRANGRGESHMREETSSETKQVPTEVPSDEAVAAPRVAHWWRRPVAATSRASKAACMLAAAFALTAVLGVTPSKVVAEELDHSGATQEEAQQESLTDEESDQWASTGDDSDSRNAIQVAATVPDPIEPHMQPTTDSSTSLSLAAAYVSEEQNESGDGSGGDDDATSEDSERELNDEVLTSTGDGSTVLVGAGESLVARGSTIISLSPSDSSALSVTDGATADIAAASTLSARGENSIALACTGTGSLACLSDSSAYASGEKCAAIAATDGASVSMERGSLEATSGTIVRAEGSGSSVSLVDVQILSTGSLAELCGDAALSLDGVTSASSHAAAIYVAAGVPSLRLTNGSVVRGTIVIADGADIDIQTDATSRIDGRIVYLSAANVA